ncbi:Uncharacterised protein [Mycobacterium tuberculosis]|nr:Uncharacterised protein [Mycobacterium tuberculosis]COW81535.1 Uncharacterised protein [Mycobacterium tuberculosis]
MTIAAIAMPSITGTLIHMRLGIRPCRNRKPNTTPVPSITKVVTRVRIAFARIREIRPDARCTGSTHSRASSPKERSRIRSIATKVDPVIAAPSAISGTML